MASFASWFISVVVITLDFDYVITFQQPLFEPGMDLFFGIMDSPVRGHGGHYIGRILWTIRMRA